MARRRKRPTGQCHICGKIDVLSYEHVPPEAAFNDRPTLRADIMKLLGAEEHGRDVWEQRGSGGFTLCESCNNNTGNWYAKDYVEFARQAMIFLNRASGATSLAFPYWIFPLRVFKEIIAMFCSAVGPGFTEKQPYIRKFLLNKEKTGFPPEFHVYAGYTLGPNARQSGFSGVFKDLGREVFTFSEVAYPPFAFVLTAGSPAPDPRLVDLSYLANYSYNEWGSHFLSLPRVETVSPLPGDYRPREEIRRLLEKEPPGEES